MIGYHAASEAGLASYEASGAILPPVRFWVALEDAEAFARSHGRKLVLRIEAEDAHMLLREPFGVAYWTPQPVRSWTMVKRLDKKERKPRVGIKRISLYVSEEADYAARLHAAHTRQSLSSAVEQLLRLGAAEYRSGVPLEAADEISRSAQKKGVES